jgi:hypothetical protein
MPTTPAELLQKARELGQKLRQQNAVLTELPELRRQVLIVAKFAVKC